MLKILFDDGVTIDICVSSDDKLISLAVERLEAAYDSWSPELKSKNFLFVDFVAIVVFTGLYKKDFHALVKFLVDNVSFFESS